MYSITCSLELLCKSTEHNIIALLAFAGADDGTIKIQTAISARNADNGMFHYADDDYYHDDEQREKSMSISEKQKRGNKSSEKVLRRNKKKRLLLFAHTREVTDKIMHVSTIKIHSVLLHTSLFPPQRKVA